MKTGVKPGVKPGTKTGDRRNVFWFSQEKTENVPSVPGLVVEVADAGEDHGRAQAVRRRHYFGIAQTLPPP